MKEGAKRKLTLEDYAYFLSNLDCPRLNLDQLNQVLYLSIKSLLISLLLVW